MIPGIELVSGYLVFWAMRKAGRVASHLDRDVDSLMDRLYELVKGKLGGDPALRQLESQATSGPDVEPRTRHRVQLAVEDLAEQDLDFATRLSDVLSLIQGSPGDPGTRDVTAVDAANARFGRNAFIGHDQYNVTNKLTERVRNITKGGKGAQTAIIVGVLVLLAVFGTLAAVVVPKVLKSDNQISAGDCARLREPDGIVRTSCSEVARPDVHGIDRVVENVQSPLFVCASDKGYLDPEDNTLYCFTD
jgi:hypothetical protein